MDPRNVLEKYCMLMERLKQYQTIERSGGKYLHVGVKIYFDYMMVRAVSDLDYTFRVILAFS
jgi:hypothetical protein